MNIRVPLVQIL